MNNTYLLKFPHGVVVDINNVPEDFDAIIAKSFSEFTYGTAKEYTYQDKLYYIDLMRKYAHQNSDEEIDSWDEVKKLIKKRFEYNLEENGEITSEYEYLNTDFMVECYEAGLREGNRPLYDKYGDDHHIYDKVMSLLSRAIKVVMDWERK